MSWKIRRVCGSCNGSMDFGKNGRSQSTWERDSYDCAYNYSNNYISFTNKFADFLKSCAFGAFLIFGADKSRKTSAPLGVGHKADCLGVSKSLPRCSGGEKQLPPQLSDSGLLPSLESKGTPWFFLCIRKYVRKMAWGGAEAVGLYADCENSLVRRDTAGLASGGYQWTHFIHPKRMG